VIEKRGCFIVTPKNKSLMGRNVPIWDVTKRIPQYYNVDFRLLVG
jgi:hypothetical protein